MDDFEQKVAEAWQAEFAGWDFGWLEGCYREESPPWSYPQMAREYLGRASAVLDIGTGGGEFFSALAPYPRRAVAVEAYPPNIPIAGRRLIPLGVDVVGVGEEAALPFVSGSFDLALNRHDGLNCAEMYRILQPGGWFLSQQVGGRNCIRLNELLGGEPFPYADWTLEWALEILGDAGFSVYEYGEAFPAAVFLDIGAVVYYLKVISWQIPNFTPQAFEVQLRKVYDIIRREGSLRVPEHRFYFAAQKPD